MDWYHDLLEQTEGHFDTLDVTVPCCHTTASLDTLNYHWPCGFARFEIAVANATRDTPEFTADEPATLATILGHPVRQILAHI